LLKLDGGKLLYKTINGLMADKRLPYYEPGSEIFAVKFLEINLDNTTFEAT